MFLKTLFAKEKEKKSSTKVDITRHFTFPNGHFTDLRVRVFPTQKFSFQAVVLLSPLSLEGEALPLNIAFEPAAMALSAEYALTGKHICWVEHFPGSLFSSGSTGTSYRLIDWSPQNRGALPSLQTVSRQVIEFLIGESLQDMDEISASPHFQALVELDSVANELNYMAEHQDNAEELTQLSNLVRSSISDLMKLI